MSNVIVDKQKIDILANAISAKSGEPVTMTLAEMVSAVDGIEQGVTPTGNIYITSAGVTDVTEYATATVPEGEIGLFPPSISYQTINGARKYVLSATAGIESGDDMGTEGYLPDHTVFSKTTTGSAIAKNTSVTPIESSQTIGGADTMLEGAVTVNAIPSNYVGSGITQRTSSDLTVSGATVTAPSGYYENAGTKTVPNATLSNTDISELLDAGYDFDSATGTFYSWASVEDAIQPITQAGYIATSTNISIYGNTEENEYQLPTQGATTITPTTSSQTAVTAGKYTTGAITVSAMPSGTEGTPTATKGAVNNHSISVTPSVTNTTGYITGSTKTGTAVSVSASELVSGNLAITSNGSGIDVTEYATVSVSVSGGGGSSMTVATATKTLTSAASSIQFTGLSGEPTSFVVTSSADQTTGGTKVVSVAYDGTNLFGMDITTQMENDTGFTKSYSSGTLTITATTAEFQANEYKLVYTYGGSSSDIHTADVQVGSGATSITFSSLSGRPTYFSCVFKSMFSTSSGYQRVIDVVNDGTNTYGHAMDSEANAQTSWSYSYSGGSLTITSTGTNNGGYFHQPGYYQLTYAVDSSAPQYESVSKTYRASTTAQSETITPSSGYDAIEEVSVSIPAVTQTNLTAANIKSGTTISISNGSTNLWSVTGTYTGGGGGSMNVQTSQSTSRTTSTSLASVNSLTCSTTGTYDVYWTCTRSSTSGTWSSRLYIGGTASGSEQTTWSNHIQNVKLTNVSISANQTVAVYAKSRGNNYYAYAPQLTIVQTS